MTKIEIKREYKDARKKLKNGYLDEKRRLKEEYARKLDEYYSSADYKNPSNPPRRPVLEEIGNAVTHGVGAVFAVAAFILMLMRSDTAAEYVATSVYFAGLFFMFAMSCLYHSFPYGSKVKRLFRRFDYSSIYLLIGATFTPILLCYIGGVYGITFATVQWAVIATGVTFIGVFGPTRLKWLHFPLYFILGWSAVVFIPKMVTTSLAFFFWILGGGIIYSLGTIPFAIDKKVSHFLWHFFVLAGAVVQLVGIYLYIYCV